ncbi:hypothetical protein QQF64_014583 [Cirrhinus molitorella]|uniref:Paraneoplastic antigen Ma-like C-terminal domain-containing protein n=1 Tax=Cirrhinus molitorella TaxID=172907 RepID=A0ABR3NTG9_9TELE
MDIIDPPSIQKVVVEHIVQTSDTAPLQHTSFSLRSFFGKVPRPVNEPDFDTWRASVDLLLTDPSISDLHRTRKILDSLLPPAADIVRHVSPTSLPATNLELLESVYGSFEDGDELLARFMSTLQNNELNTKGTTCLSPPACASGSTDKVKSKGDNGHPWRVPRPSGKKEDANEPVRTRAEQQL